MNTSNPSLGQVNYEAYQRDQKKHGAFSGLPWRDLSAAQRDPWEAGASAVRGTVLADALAWARENNLIADDFGMSPGLTGLRSHAPRLRRLAQRAADYADRALHVCVVNAPDSGYPDAQVRRLAVACAIQMQRDLAPEYGVAAPTVEFLPAGVAPPAASSTAEVAVLGVVPKIPLDPTAQGWHQPLGVGAASGTGPCARRRPSSTPREGPRGAASDRGAGRGRRPGRRRAESHMLRRLTDR